MMQTTIFEELLSQADTTARQGDWERTLDHLQQAVRIKPDHAGTLSGIGTCLIQLERPADAIPHFQRVIALAPDSAEAHNNLGVVYSLIGNSAAAQGAFQKALDLDPNYMQAWKNLALVLLRQGQYGQGAETLAAVVQANPQDVEALYLLAQCYEEGQEYGSARLLYREILKHQPDFLPAQQGLDRLPPPLAAVADVTRIARPEHAQKLASLKSLKGLKREEPPAPNPLPAPKSVAFYGPPAAATEKRLGPVARGLASQGILVKVSTTFDPSDLDRFQTFVFARPHTSPELLAGLNRCVQAGKYILVDLDENFHHLPAEHPGCGRLSSPETLSSLEAALAQASRVTVASPALAEQYRKFSPQVEVLLSGWDSGNALWEKIAPSRTTVNIGLLSPHVFSKDIPLLKADLARILRQFPQALLVVAQDLSLYQAFDTVPEERRMFLPAGRVEDYPYLLSSFDLLLVPLKNTPYNQARADQPLLEAGIRRIPWVASPIPAFKDWGTGGLFAGKAGDWYAALKKLLEQPDLRRELGEAGQRKAEAREIRVQIPFLESVLFQGVTK